MRRARVLAPIVAVVLTSACGVSSEDEPQPIKDSTSQRPEATPSVDTEPGPVPPPASSSTLTTTPSPSTSGPPPPAAGPPVR
jgi:uncharacterized lipoprotein